MSDMDKAAVGGEDDLKRKLVMRVAFAGILIGLLLGALAFIDYLGTPSDEPVASGPAYTSPVPVPKKEVSQPVKSAELSAPATVAEAPPAPEATAPAPVPAAEVPAKPEVPAQPSLPPAPAQNVVATSRPVARPAPAAVPEGTSSSSQFFPPAEKPAPAAAPAAPAPAPAVVDRQPPAPPRLFSGYAVQAGVFADAQHAEELRAKLTLNGIPSTMEARVQVGPFKTREEAESARQKLKAMGIDGVLLPPRNARK